MAVPQTNGLAENNKSFDSFQKFLDEQQYSKTGVQRYEWIFGETFLSTGGLETTKTSFQVPGSRSHFDAIKGGYLIDIYVCPPSMASKYILEPDSRKLVYKAILSRLHLKPGDKVLDVGSGLGGHDFYMAEEFGVNVHGVDLSVNMMSVALEHLAKRPQLKSKVQLEICDVTKAAYEDCSFDVIYSRDCLLHIADKEALFRRFMKWLKPGGKILFTDYGRGDKDDYSQEFKAYVASRGYNLLTVEQYGKLLSKVGFVNVEAVNYTEYFLECLKKELKKLNDEKYDFLQKFSNDDYNYLNDGWKAKIQRVEDGDQQWIMCYAEKPHSQ